MSPKRSDEFKADRREEILAAAIELFVTRGYDRTTTREIARATGVSTGAIYTYFPTKAAMLQAVCTDEATRMRALIESTLRALPADADPLAAGLMTFIGRFGTLGPAERRRREQIELMLRYEATRDAAIAASVRELIASWRMFVVAILRAQQAAGRIRAEIDAVALAELFLALPNGLEFTELLSGTPTDWPALVGTLADVLWHGLAPSRALVAAAPDRTGGGAPREA